MNSPSALHPITADPTAADPTACDVIAADGRLVHLRAAVRDDEAGLLALLDRASDASIHRRFFTANRAVAARYVSSLVTGDDDGRLVIVAERADVVVGLGSLELDGRAAGEVAFLVDEALHGLGIGTLLLEHLVGLARRHRIATIHADVLASNTAMIRVFVDSGFEIALASSAGLVTVTLTSVDGAPIASEFREGAAGHLLMQHLTSPRSVVVIGAGHREGSIGHEVLRNLQRGGFTGRVEVVNPRTASVRGVVSYPSVLSVPGPIDLAIVAVPAAQVPTVLDECGAAGVKGMVILTSGLGEVGVDARQEERLLVLRARRHGMRIVGPNCLGIINTDPEVRLDATFADQHPVDGALAIGSQSGAVGVSLLTEATASGLGVSEFVSLGNKADISGNDLLLHWQGDPRTKVVALYLESIGDPRKFSTIAGLVRRTKPVLVIKSGRSLSGQRAGLSHSAAAMSSDTAVDTLFAQAGVLRMESTRDMVDAARVLTLCPPMAGPRLGVLGNAGGAGILAADAAERCGLQVPVLSDPTAQAMVSAGAVAAVNPVDLGAGTRPDAVESAARLMLDSGEIDALVVIFVVTRAGDVAACFEAVARAASSTALPVVAVCLGQNPGGHTIPLNDSREMPVFDSPEPAVRAVGRAWEYASFEPGQGIRALRPEEVDADAVSAHIEEFLRANPDGGWMGPNAAAEIVERYGLSILPCAYPHTEEAAVTAAQHLGYPVVLKTADRRIVHKTDIGAVRVGLACDTDVVAAYRAVAAATGSPAVVVQAMAPKGVELTAGIVTDRRFGPMLTVGAGGVLTELIGDRHWRMVPLAKADARTMLDGMAFAPLLRGYRGSRALDVDAAARLVDRLGALAATHREVVEVDINPFVVGENGAHVVDVKMRIDPAGADAADGWYSRHLS